MKNKFRTIFQPEHSIKANKALELFRKNIINIIDTGCSINYIIERLQNDWYPEHDFSLFIKENNFTQPQIIEILHKLDKEKLIAIDPYDQHVEVEQFKPNACTKIRLLQEKYAAEQLHGTIKSELIFIPEIIEVVSVTNKTTNKTAEYNTMEDFEKAESITFRDKREYRKGLPSKYDFFIISVRNKQIQVEQEIQFILKPDGTKLYEKDNKKLFTKTYNILSKFDDPYDENEQESEDNPENEE